MSDLNVIQVIAAVKTDIGAVAKARRNEQQGYAFRGIEDFLNAVHDVMARHGLVIVPAHIEHSYEIRERPAVGNSKGGITVHTWLHTTWHAYGPRGPEEYIPIVTVGEAADTMDKSTNKAMSAAEKYMLITTFKIGTEDSIDGDSESPDMGSGPSERGGTTGTRSPQERAQAIVAKHTSEGHPTDKQVNLIIAVSKKLFISPADETAFIKHVTGETVAAAGTARLSYAQGQKLISALKAAQEGVWPEGFELRGTTDGEPF